MVRFRVLFIAIVLGIAALATPSYAKGSSGLSTKKPIEIAADALEVLQEKGKAEFKGNVEATQGMMKLKADRMLVHYINGKDRKASDNAISLIEVFGNVFLSTPNETAKGDNGEYNVEKEVLILTGDVAITKDKNIIKGHRIVYNLATGKTRMEGGNATGSKESGAAPSSGRVRGLFVPKE